MAIKIVQQSEDRLYKYGSDNSGNCFVFCKKCNKTMSMYDYGIDKREKVLSFVCKGCKAKKTLRNKLF